MQNSCCTTKWQHFNACTLHLMKAWFLLNCKLNSNSYSIDSSVGSSTKVRKSTKVNAPIKNNLSFETVIYLPANMSHIYLGSPYLHKMKGCYYTCITVQLIQYSHLHPERRQFSKPATSHKTDSKNDLSHHLNWCKNLQNLHLPMHQQDQIGL